MTFINYAEVAAGKLLVDPLAVSASDVFLGGYRYVAANNAMRVADGTAPAVFHGGLAFTAEGRLCVQSGAVAAAAYVNGLALTSLGQVLVDGAAAPVGYVHGWPVAADGKLCVSGISTVTSAAHFTGAGQSITSPRTWAPDNQFVIEAQVKLTGPTGSVYYSILTANPGTPQIDLVYAVTGNFELRIIDTIAGVSTWNSTGTPPINTALIWVRVVGNAPNVTFFTSPDRVTWTPLGVVLQQGTYNMVSKPAQTLQIGGVGSFYGFVPWIGDIGRVQTWYDVAKTLPGFDMDPSKWVSGTTFVSGGDTYTLNGGVTIS